MYRLCAKSTNSGHKEQFLHTVYTWAMVVLYFKNARLTTIYGTKPIYTTNLIQSGDLREEANVVLLKLVSLVQLRELPAGLCEV